MATPNPNVPTTVADNTLDPSEESTEVVDPNKTVLPKAPSSVEMHPLVLLSCVDHFARINAKVSDTKRVVGLLVGSPLMTKEGNVVFDIHNSFAVPFDEDPKDNSIWFLDINYADKMYTMFRKVAPKLRVLGWYSSGPQISANDLAIHLEIAKKFCPTPCYAIINVDPRLKGVPVVSYLACETKGSTEVEFKNLTTELGTMEAEDIGIEHLLRDVTDSTISTLSTKIQDRQLALHHLDQVLKNVESYLVDVADGNLPVNYDILSLLQELVNLFPTVNQRKTSAGMIVSQNDDAMYLFVASLTRCVMALYDLIMNRRKLAKELKEIQKKKKEDADKAQSEKEKKATAAAAEKKD